MAATPCVSDFCAPLAAVLIVSTIPGYSPFGAIQPSGSNWMEKQQVVPGGNFRTLQKVLIKVWREVLIPSLHFFPADIFFFVLMISHWMSFHSLILFPSLRLLVLSPLPFPWSQALNHLPSIFTLFHLLFLPTYSFIIYFSITLVTMINFINILFHFLIFFAHKMNISNLLCNLFSHSLLYSSLHLLYFLTHYPFFILPITSCILCHFSPIFLSM